ncbi:E3 ubiquitin-protein ligase rnf146 [Ciona intestinalis]
MTEEIDCAICLQPCMQPVELPCSHVFCFLCAKGTALQSRRCALCRSEIPTSFISKPSKFTKADPTDTPSSSTTDPIYVWFYQGYNGWWQYDERTCAEIEAAYLTEVKSVDLMIAGSVYVIDFENKIQFQRNRNSRKRKIKRDIVSALKKGVAGLSYEGNPNNQPQACGNKDMASAMHLDVNDEQSPDNEGQTK